MIVDGNSMQDTLQDHELMFVTKFDYIFGEPESGDVVICKYPESTKNYVKRLIGLPGDTLEIKDNTVYRNGVALPGNLPDACAKRQSRSMPTWRSACWVRMNFL